MYRKRRFGNEYYKYADIRKIIAKDETAVKAANIESIGFFLIDGFNINSFYSVLKH